MEPKDVKPPDIGMSGSIINYSLLKQKGDSESEVSLQMYLYPNTESDEGWCEDESSAIPGALTSLGDQLLQAEPFNIINQYQIWKADEFLDMEYPGSAEQLTRNIPDVLNKKNVNFRGSHLLIHGFSKDGWAFKGDNDNAFNTRMEACVGTELISNDRVNFNFTAKEFVKNVAIQEVVHNIINKKLGAYKKRIEKDQHDLGHMIGGWFASITPMCTSYEEDGAIVRGKCSNVKTPTGYTTTISSCTKKSIRDTVGGVFDWPV